MEEQNVQQEDKEFFVLGYWVEPYSCRKEYFWMRYFDTRKEALEAGKRKQHNGQPKTFRDWCEGTNRVFSSAEAFVKAAQKVGLNPKMD